MYARYQQYQNNQQQQQQQQQSVNGSSSQSGGAAQWNGTAWVYPNNNNNTQPQQKQQTVPPNPVETFTQYYHGWNKREEELKNYLRTLGANSSERQNTESNRQWAKYYSEESSRAAHHFHQHPQTTSAPFDLPPAPPTVGYSSNSNNSSNSNSNNNSATTGVSNSIDKQNTNSTTTSTTASKSNPSGSITRYVKKNIQRLEVQKDPKLKAHVQSEIEKEIAAAIQKGTLQSKNWDLVPLIQLPNAKPEAPKPVPPPPPPPPPPEHTRYQQQQHQTSSGSSYHRQQNTYGGGNHYQNNSSAYPNNNITTNNYGNSSGNYYGHAESVSNTSSKKFGDGKGQTSGSYYGPASSSHENNNKNKPAHNNFQQLDSSSSQNNNNFFSSSSYHLGKNKHSQRHHQQAEEDFIPMGIYGPSDSSTPKHINKKSKKNHRKHNKLVVVHNEDNEMDQSQQTMSKRANRFSGRGGIYEANTANARSSMGLYGYDKYMGKGTIGGNKTILDENDYEQMTVKGTSIVLEKEYLRLTAPPRAEFVRPFGILQQHLLNLQSEYFCCRDSEGAATAILQYRMKTPQSEWESSDLGDKGTSRFRKRQHDYLWFCSQLKAIRQDCTVQRIQGDLAVDVYETHARIALQEGDLNE